MNHLLIIGVITGVTVVSSFQQFHRQINDGMQVRLNIKQFRDTQISNTGDLTGDSNTLSELRSENMMHNNSPKAKQTKTNSNTFENLGQVGEIDYAEQLSMLVDNMMHTYSIEANQPFVTNEIKLAPLHSKTALTIPTDAPKSQTQQHDANLPSKNNSGLGKFRSRMFARFHRA